MTKDAMKQPNVHDLFYGAPVHAPAIVTDSWAIVAVCSLGSVLVFWPMYLIYAQLFQWLNGILGIPREPPLALVFVSSVILCTLPPSYFAFSSTSRHILRLVRFYLDNGNLEAAKSLSLGLDYQVWFRDIKKNLWFRSFLIENGLSEKSIRYKRMLSRVVGG
jgi:hypothetical protein